MTRSSVHHRHGSTRGRRSDDSGTDSVLTPRPHARDTPVLSDESGSGDTATPRASTILSAVTSHDIESTRPHGDTVVGPGSAEDALAQLLTRAAEWEALIRYDPVERVRVRLADGNVEAWLMTWLPQQATTWHVHQSAGCFTSVRGELTEQVASYPSAVDLDSPAATPARVIAVRAPQQVVFPTQRLHRVVNLGSEPAISLLVMESSRERAVSPSPSGSHPGGQDVSPEADEQLLTPGEVAAYFRVHPKTITRWAESGRLTSVRTLGNHRRFRASEVRALRRDHHE